MSTTRQPVDRYGLHPIGRLVAVEWLSRLRTAPALTDADYIRGLLEHANATPETVENLFTVKAGAASTGTSDVRGQMYPASVKGRWIQEWRDRLAVAIRDHGEAVTLFGPSILAAYNHDTVWLPEVSISKGRFETSVRMNWTSLEAAMWHAVRLLLDQEAVKRRLSQCKHCGNFFLAEREHKHGKVRRDYCSRKHFEAAQRQKTRERVSAHRRKPKVKAALYAKARRVK